jgi:hypothetical protein
VLDRTIWFKAPTLAQVIKMYELGSLHLTLAPLPTWSPDEDQRAQLNHTIGAIAEVNGFGRDGRLDADFAATLRLLCEPRVEFYGWLVMNDGVMVSVLAAATGDNAVLAYREGDTVWLNPADPRRLADMLVACTPNATPGNGQPFTVGLSELRQQLVEGAEGQVMAGAGAHRSVEVQRVLTLIETPLIGNGELYTAARACEGTRRAPRHPLRYADTLNGRFLQRHVEGEEPMMLVAPADRWELAEQLNDMHAELSR